jgi:hypothetical protein
MRDTEAQTSLKSPLLTRSRPDWVSALKDLKVREGEDRPAPTSPKWVRRELRIVRRRSPGPACRAVGGTSSISRYRFLIRTTFLKITFFCPTEFKIRKWQTGLSPPARVAGTVPVVRSVAAPLAVSARAPLEPRCPARPPTFAPPGPPSRGRAPLARTARRAPAGTTCTSPPSSSSSSSPCPRSSPGSPQGGNRGKQRSSRRSYQEHRPVSGTGRTALLLVVVVVVRAVRASSCGSTGWCSRWLAGPSSAACPAGSRPAGSPA